MSIDMHLAAAVQAPGAANHRPLVALAAGLVLILLLLLIALVVVTLLWRRIGRHRREVATLRAKVDDLEDLWAEAGNRFGTATSTASRPGLHPRSRGGEAPRPGGRSLDPPGPDAREGPGLRGEEGRGGSEGGEDDDRPPPGFHG